MSKKIIEFTKSVYSGYQMKYTLVDRHDHDRVLTLYTNSSPYIVELFKNNRCDYIYSLGEETKDLALQIFVNSLNGEVKFIEFSDELNCIKFDHGYDYDITLSTLVDIVSVFRHINSNIDSNRCKKFIKAIIKNLSENINTIIAMDNERPNGYRNKTHYSLPKTATIDLLTRAINSLYAGIVNYFDANESLDIINELFTLYDEYYDKLKTPSSDYLWNTSFLRYNETSKKITLDQKVLYYKYLLGRVVDYGNKLNMYTISTVCECILDQVTDRYTYNYSSGKFTDAKQMVIDMKENKLKVIDQHLINDIVSLSEFKKFIDMSIKKCKNKKTYHLLQLAYIMYKDKFSWSEFSEELLKSIFIYGIDSNTYKIENSISDTDIKFIDQILETDIDRIVGFAYIMGMDNERKEKHMQRLSYNLAMVMSHHIPTNKRLFTHLNNLFVDIDGNLYDEEFVKKWFSEAHLYIDSNTKCFKAAIAFMSNLEFISYSNLDTSKLSKKYKKAIMENKLQD